MKVKCKKNKLLDIPKKLRRYAFTQDDEGNLDLSIENVYEVFGIKETHRGVFYLVHTDVLNTVGMWWMPAELYEVIDPTIPERWAKKKIGWFRSETYQTLSAYYDWRVAEGIEDGDKNQVEKFLNS